MELLNLTWVGLLAAATALTACGKAETKGEATSAATPAPAVVSAANASSANDLGVPLYPGMQTLVSAHLMPGGMVTADFKSADKPEKIAAFYSDQLGKFADKMQLQVTVIGEGMLRIQAANEKGQFVTILIRREGTESIVGIQTLPTK